MNPSPCPPYIPETDPALSDWTVNQIGMVRGYFYKTLGIKKHADVEDGSQEVWRVFTEKRREDCQQFPPTEELFKAWLFTTSRFVFSNHLRKNYRRRASEQVDYDDNLHAKRALDDDIVERKELMAIVATALRRLPVHYAEILVADLQGKLSDAQIAELKKISEVTVRTRRARGQQQLRDMLNPNPPDAPAQP